ncbi:UPF0280 family protein [Shimia sp. MMG029]|uniref:UPF0280 family protein n=1 Tax=Shimia sp. MMG029 TaxID=3021978 RepID=UPI0022FDD535|nr:UPF0280 family protein [Shimia sp. MMG029]MDA5555897.1 UPF0280 family protein [Shimia sp. MMG029]
MMDGPQVTWLPDGRRLHMHHGPIDLILEIWGHGRAQAYRAATLRFETVLQELVDELPKLRLPVERDCCFIGRMAQKMQSATRMGMPDFVTPMAAVAGAVADEIARVIAAVPDVSRAYVNNGGDVALLLTEGQSLRATVAGADAEVTIHADDPIRGVATSGWRGRSLSLGVADAVTVLARTAAEADVAATLIANHVDVPGHPLVRRAPACDLREESDLGARLVTVGVGRLPATDVAEALARGVQYAEGLSQKIPLAGVYLHAQGQARVMGSAFLHHACEGAELL